MSKKALLVGINAYADPASNLRGCLNDVRQVRGVLAERFRFGEGPGALRVLLDARATGSAIRTGLRWLVHGAGPGDLLVFHYSGHGSQVPDRNGDERGDRLDEILCPHDMDWNDPFTDDELDAIVRQVPGGAVLAVVLDCCHAGTGLREGRARCLPPPPSLTPAPRPHSGTGLAARRLRRFGHRAAAAGALLIAACRDDQVSADAFIDGAFHGALTYYLCEALAGSGYATTYERLVIDVRRRLRANGFDQVPQLEGPQPLRTASVFEAPELAAS